jgi:transketolase
MIAAGKAGHMGGAMSCTDLLTALYFHAMNIDPHSPNMPERDRFILSASHKCMAQYAVLCECGFFDETLLDTYGKLGTKLSGHPDMHKISGVEANTGALGHGLSIAVGMALGLRGSAGRIFVLLGDGELPEGSNWEAIAAAGHHKLDNLNVFVDANGLQISGRTEDIMDMEPISEKFNSFGWVTETIDGNDMGQVVNVLDVLPLKKGKPSAIIMHTVKGKGLSFAENQVSYHYWKPSPEELAEAEKELDESVRRNVELTC